ncbi:MAG: hypothetical protein J0I99_19890 [Devosia sp.]|uniref:WD40/YVTN/BNR-like repeat-containing protein n=1 Tax=Devosia sp. TaxID=1871048 RepID=UPI001AC2F084|nr:hypothetical protein [Devosia sp.]MBN9318008.1 hypothetical protein [Devosia sp.]
MSTSRLSSSLEPVPLNPALSRRRFLAAGATAVAGLVLHPVVLGAQALSVTALAFDGGDLVVARGSEVQRLAVNGKWNPLPAPGATPVLALATHVGRPGLVVAGLASGAVAVSVGGGRNWEDRSSGLPGGRVAALTVAATKPETFYASVLGDGLWRSEDEGRTWSLAMDRPWLNEQEQDVVALASVELATGMGGIWIYAGTNVGLTRVPDCFCRWQDVQPGDAMDALASGGAPKSAAPLPKGEIVQALVSAPAKPETLYAALPSGLWKSEDAGVVWSRLIAGRSSAIAVHPTNPAHVVAEIDGVLQRTADGGTRWSTLPPNGVLQ